MHSPLNEQPHGQHSASSLLSSGAQQYHQIHDNGSHQQYLVRSPNRSPSSPIIPVKPSLSKHSRVGDYQGIHRWITDILGHASYNIFKMLKAFVLEFIFLTIGIPQHDIDQLPPTYQENQNFATTQLRNHIITNPDPNPESIDKPPPGMGIPLMDRASHQQPRPAILSPSQHQIGNNIVQTKQLIVSSNNGPNGQNYHSSTIAAHHHQNTHEQFPDLLNMQNTHKASPVLQNARKSNQPLNPSALVLPPSPPFQFPHQFPHLIHPAGRSNITPHTSPSNQSQAKRGPPPPPPARSHSYENTFNDSPHEAHVAPLLSPPAQFGHPTFVDAKSSKQQQDAAFHKGYATLPRKLQHNQEASTGKTSHNISNNFNDTKRGLVDWAIMSDRIPIYDGVGPRTSATGSSHNVNHSGDEDNAARVLSFSVSNNMPGQKPDPKTSNHPKCDCPDILEISSAQVSNKSKQKPPQRSSSLRKADNSNKVNIVSNINPLTEGPHRGDISVHKYENRCIPHDPRRDSSGSEVSTLANESMSGYFEPFGKALPPPPPPAGVTVRNNQAKSRDSIVSTESDLDSMLGMYSSGGTRRQSCPLHKTHPNLQHNSSKNTLQNDANQRPRESASNSAEVKHLKGILKGGSMNKPNDQLNGSYTPTTKITSITTNPVATAAVEIYPSCQKTVIVSSSAYREKSLSPNSSSTTSSPSPPPLAPLADYTGNRVGININDSKTHLSYTQKSQDNSAMKVVKIPSLTATTLNLSKGQILSLKQTNSTNSNPAISSGHPKPPEKVLSNSSSSSSFSVRESNSSTSTVSGSLQGKNSGANVEALNV